MIAWIWSWCHKCSANNWNIDILVVEDVLNVGCIDAVQVFLGTSWDEKFIMVTVLYMYLQISNIRHILTGNKNVDHSDVVGAWPVGAAPTTSSFWT